VRRRVGGALALASVSAKLVATALSWVPVVDRERTSFHGKAMGVRAVGYPAFTLALPAAWLAAGRPRPYPWRADLALSAPLVVDAGGNVLGLFTRHEHFDRISHGLGWTFVALAAGDAIRPVARHTGLTVLGAIGVGAIVAVAWEIGEFAAWKRFLGARPDVRGHDRRPGVRAARLGRRRGVERRPSCVGRRDVSTMVRVEVSS
jgi:hypothetical protein